MVSAVQPFQKVSNRLLKDIKILDEPLELDNLSTDINAILMEVKRFTQSTLIIKECCKTLVKIFKRIVKGETLSPKENSDIFFSITQLFQSPNRRLRRLVYLVVKNLEVESSEFFILTSSLSKDLNSDNDCNRANALRVFSKIANISMASQIEKYLKTAVVDKNPFVACSALVCGIHLWKVASSVVKRWVNEITETVNNSHPMVQFHSIALLYEMKKSDRLALQKIVIMLSKKDSKSPLAECLVMRYSVKLLCQDTDSTIQKTLMTNLERSLANSNEMIRLEAAKSFTSLVTYFHKDLNNGILFGFELLPSVITLRDFLSSSKPVVRFAAVRQLNILSQYCPHLLTQFSQDVELLLSDPSRNIASLALASLLKFGNESNIDRLIKQITSFMNDGTDSFKLDVLKAVNTLCLTYPYKHRTLMTVLATSLREDGNFDSKNESVNAIMTIIDQIPDAVETGISHLCEFIEDCEFPSLCMSILSFLGERIPSTNCPSKYIRFIYNRLILENAHLRAAGVDSLAKISRKCPELRKDILILLEVCSTDNDDEVRDRTNLYSKIIEMSFDKPSSSRLSSETSVETMAPPSLDSFFNIENELSLDFLCEQLTEHIETNIESTFDTSRILSNEDYEKSRAIETQNDTSKVPLSTVDIKPQPSTPPTIKDPEQDLIEAVSSIVNFKSLGPVLVSSRWQSLTEREAEYGVTVKKVFFNDFLVLEFMITNTIADEELTDAFVFLSGLDPTNWAILGSVPIKSLCYDSPESSYVVLQPLSQNLETFTDTFDVQLRYQIVDGYSVINDEYAVDPLVIGISDYIIPQHLRSGQFMIHWERYIPAESEKIGQYSLNFRSAKDAAESLLTSFNMSACEKSDMVDSNKSKHTLLLSGSYLNKVEVLCVATIFVDYQHGCLLKFSCRCMDPLVRDAIIGSLD